MTVSRQANIDDPHTVATSGILGHVLRGIAQGMHNWMKVSLCDQLDVTGLLVNSMHIPSVFACCLAWGVVVELILGMTVSRQANMDDPRRVVTGRILGHPLRGITHSEHKRFSHDRCTWNVFFL